MWNPDNENNPQEIWETPAGVYVWGSVRLELLNADNWGGWINADNITHYKRKPVRPVIFPDEKTSYMRNMGSRGYCVTEFLEKINNVKKKKKKNTTKTKTTKKNNKNQKKNLQFNQKQLY